MSLEERVMRINREKAAIEGIISLALKDAGYEVYQPRISGTTMKVTASSGEQYTLRVEWYRAGRG